MEYNENMNLISESGYCMPFNGKNEDVKLVSKFGENGNTNIILETDRYVLKGIADGIVTAIGTNPATGLYQTTRYDKYEVTYGGIFNALVGFGKKVKAGSILAISGKKLILEVKYDGELIDPIDFLSMIYGNMRMTETGNESGFPEFDTLDIDIPTDYDDNREEIESLMAQYYPNYLKEIIQGIYQVPEHTEQSLRNVFSMSSMRNCFFETIPSMSNPLGVGERSIPMAVKVQNLLIRDFLNYLALRHQIFLSAMDELNKKKAMTKPSPQPES